MTHPTIDPDTNAEVASARSAADDDSPRYPPRDYRPSEPSRMPAKTPVLAAMLSVIPGLGNVYNGLYARGVAFFFVWASLFALAIEAGDSGQEQNLGFLIPSMVFFWLFNLFDAYRQATMINLGLTEEEPALLRGRTIGSDLMLGVALLVIGLYGILVKYFDFDMAWVLDNWPVGVTAFGAWLVFQAWKQRAEDRRVAD